MDSPRPTPTILAQRATDGKFQRAHNRFSLEIEVSLHILIPEDTFAPQKLDGKTVDVSARGMQVGIDGLPHDLYAKLLARTRHVRVMFRTPVVERQIKITGRISWIDYRKPKADKQSGPCRIGIFFDVVDGIDLGPYTEFIGCIRPI